MFYIIYCYIYPLDTGNKRAYVNSYCDPSSNWCVFSENKSLQKLPGIRGLNRKQFITIIIFMIKLPYNIRETCPTEM